MARWFFAVLVFMGLHISAAQAQQAPGAAPLQGDALIDSHKLRNPRLPPPEQRGPFPPRKMLGCTFYEDADFLGRSRKYTVAIGVKSGTYTHAVSYVGDDFNDRISSFRCDNSCRAQLYTDRNFDGHHSPDDTQVSDLRHVLSPTKGGFDDMVSSLKVICRVY